MIVTVKDVTGEADDALAVVVMPVAPANGEYIVLDDSSWVVTAVNYVIVPSSSAAPEYSSLEQTIVWVARR